MKKRNSLKLILLSFVMLIMCFCPVLTGCFSISSSKLETPELSLHDASLCLTWDKVDNTSKYEVYCNDEYIEYVSSSPGLKSYLYDFSAILTTDGKYSFHIVAVSNLRLAEDSDDSNTVTYNYSKASISSPITIDTSVNKIDNYEIEYSIKGTSVTYIPLNNIDVDKYQLYLFSQSTGLNIYDVNGTTIELQSTTFNLKAEIYALAFGVEIDGNQYVCSDIKYINPDSYGNYTDNIYLFDGFINDYYIKSLPELRNIVYYTFITRQSHFDIKLSDSFKNNIVTTFSGKNNAEKLTSALIDSYYYMYETRNGYEIECTTIEESTSQYSIYINYDEYLNSSGLPACDISNIPDEGYYAPEFDWVPFYNSCSHTMRNEDPKYSSLAYDNFASDKQFLSIEVSSSEELYWAVENKVAPIIADGSMAETIYNKAKSVLNSIISDSMTDYEKVLSIFDWICANTVYDYYSLEEGSYSSESVTIVPAYYLEGVFLTGYAVCDGFSKAFSLMCNMEGIDAIRIVGTAYSGGISGGHAWNKVLLDKDPNDGIDPQYYLVDLTWTTMISNEDTEVSSHQYFLVSDVDVAETHKYYAKRDKFAHYTSPDNYDYYNNTIFIYNKKSYDLVIDKEEELEPLFYYMLHNKLPSMEVVIDYDFIYNNYFDKGGRLWELTETRLFNSIKDTMRAKKFNEQYFSLNCNWLFERYNDAGDWGVVMVFEQRFLIDSDNETGHLIEYLSHHELYGKYRLFVDVGKIPQDGIEDYNNNNEIDYEDRVYALFSSAMITHDNVNVEFKLVNVEPREIEFEMTITPKN